MAAPTIFYTCNYTSNLYTKTKKWHSGFLRARTNHGSVSLSLYELDQYSNSRGKLVDTMDIFNSKSDSLSGQELSTSRNIIYVMDLVDVNAPKPPESAASKSLESSPIKPRPRTISKKLKPFSKPGTLSKDSQSTTDSISTSRSDVLSIKPYSSVYDNDSNDNKQSHRSDDSDLSAQKRSNRPEGSSSSPKNKVMKADKVTFADQNPTATSPINVNDIIKNIELMLE